MIKAKEIILRPSIIYLFSYVWLAAELFLFNYIIQSYFISIAVPLTIIFTLIFARLYYWLDFSPETKVQTWFILGIIPLFVIVTQIHFREQIFQILSCYLIILIGFGSFRIFACRYKINHTHVQHRILFEKNYTINQSLPINYHQHGRGKLLNFGCILIPVTDSQKNKKNLMYKLLLQKRFDIKYKGLLRIDGIKNPEETFKTINIFNK